MAECSSCQYDETNTSASAERIRRKLEERRLHQAATPFGLQGTQISFHGDGGMYNATYKSPEFVLHPGLVVVKVEHGGRGECHLQFVPADVSWGYLLSVLTAGQAGPIRWVAVDYEHEAPTWAIVRVSGRKDEHRTCMRPGKFAIEVKSTSRWSCHLIQPAMEQSRGSFPHRFVIEGGEAVAGTFRTGQRPVSVNIQHSGTGQFGLQFISLDGTHEYALGHQRNEGQFHVEERELELLPGKEYLMCGQGDGTWDVELIESY